VLKKLRWRSSVLAIPLMARLPSFLIEMVKQHIALTLIVGTALGLTLWRWFPSDATLLQIAGACLAVVGFVLWTVARFQLGASFTVTAQARQLVTRGLYSRIRNPIYVFGSCIIAGVFLLLGHPAWLAIFAFVIPLQIWRARKEAAVLQAEFGEQYRDYRSGTWF
jgi:protein-S-isoprenylcysteine O-methyltransferase Ste14